jgi:Predicted acyltransferases
VAWSLSVEEWYYVAFPPFLLLYVKLTKGTGEWFQYACATVLLITCISLLRFVYADTADWGAQVRRVVVFRIDSIAYGFLLYLVLQRVRFEWSLRLGTLAFLILAAATVVLIKVNDEMLTNDAVWLRHIHPFASAAFGVSTLVFFLSLNSLFQGPVRRAVCSYLGRISYPMYLFHLAVLYGLARVLPQDNAAWHFLLYVATAMLVSTAFYHGFEKPILAMRPRYPHLAATGVAPIHDPERAPGLR